MAPQKKNPTLTRAQMEEMENWTIDWVFNHMRANPGKYSANTDLDTYDGSGGEFVLKIPLEDAPYDLETIKSFSMNWTECLSYKNQMRVDLDFTKEFFVGFPVVVYENIEWDDTYEWDAPPSEWK